MIGRDVVDEIRGVLEEPDLERKLRAAERLCGARERIAPPAIAAEPLGPLARSRPGRPAHFVIAAPMTGEERPRLGDRRGRYLLMHSIANIELGAVELALLAAGDFPEQPIEYHRDMLQIAAEEVAHARMLLRRLRELGGELGSEPVHVGLFETTRRCPGILERLAVVPRILEAHGLDVSSRLRHQLRGAGDVDSALCLERVYQDEVGHVAIGTRWYRALCHQRGVDPQTHFLALLETWRPRRAVAIDRAGRRRAGFTDEEIEALRGRGSAAAGGRPLPAGR